ncbi:MAG: pSer/pThr/pTyr-binding forkhead associated (FHA) protein [Candidatus Azotimanducaceae bacterium]|jgi:pSer/pThr/pTyr-binding forkhead associated (FHA) protein
MLKVQFKDGRAEPVALVAPGKTIGKGDINDIVIDEKGVSGFHADLKVEGNNVTISDVDTKTGTQLNGELLAGPTNLRAGDVIMIQGVELEVVEDDPANHAKTLVLSGHALSEILGGWFLVADSGPEKGQHISVSDRTEIGRALDCDISILEPELSRKHAQIEPEGDELYLQDLGSANGTHVNGEKVNRIKLKDGDVLQFHKIRFIVRAP